MKGEMTLSYALAEGFITHEEVKIALANCEKQLQRPCYYCGEMRQQNGDACVCSDNPSEYYRYAIAIAEREGNAEKAHAIRQWLAEYENETKRKDNE